MLSVLTALRRQLIGARDLIIDSVPTSQKFSDHSECSLLEYLANFSISVKAFTLSGKSKEAINKNWLIFVFLLYFNTKHACCISPIYRVTFL